jgi:hypothetical protein
MLTRMIYGMLREIETWRRTNGAMREMRRSGYVAEWHWMTPGAKRRAARWNM